MPSIHERASVHVRLRENAARDNSDRTRQCCRTPATSQRLASNFPFRDCLASLAAAPTTNWSLPALTLQNLHSRYLNSHFVNRDGEMKCISNHTTESDLAAYVTKLHHAGHEPSNILHANAVIGIAATLPALVLVTFNVVRIGDVYGHILSACLMRSVASI